MPNWKTFCCPCYQNNCIPIIKETVLDPENPSELLDWPLPDNNQIENDEDQSIPLQVINDQPQNNEHLNNDPVPDQNDIEKDIKNE